MPFTERYWPAVPYAEASAIEQINSHEYKCKIHPEYSYGPAAHGGFMIAVMWKAIEKHFATTLAKYRQPHTFSFYIEFLRATGVGSGTIVIKDSRVGKLSSTVHATLTQRGKETAIVLASNNGDAATQGSINCDMSYQLSPPIPPVDFDACLEGHDKNWIRYDVEWVKDRNTHALCNVIFLYPRQPEPNRRFTQQWSAPRLPHERWTTDMLGLVFDNLTLPLENFIPDAVHNAYTMPARSIQNEKDGKTSYDHPAGPMERWYPTLNLAIKVVRRLPDEGVKWLFARTECKEVKDGRLAVQGEIWTTTQLIATMSSLSYAISDDQKASDSRKARVQKI